MRIFYVYADYGYITEQELFSSTSLSEALDFAHEYVQSGDFEGHVVEVAWFSDRGEYVTELCIRSEDEFPEEEGWEYFSD